MIGCACATCRSTDPHDARLRPSIYLDVPGRARILVDTATDLRQQALRYGLAGVDAILFTHGHADHVMGFDEVRRFNQLQGRAIPCYASEPTWRDLRQTFHYVFAALLQQGGGVPQIEPHTIDGPFHAAGLRVVPVPLLHGRLPILGFRFGRVAYLTDCNAIPDASWPLLDGLDLLVLDALRPAPHPTHFNLEEAVAAAVRVGAGRTLFTHIGHELPHAGTTAALPAGIELAYDGLSLDVLVDAI
jgi:phosphoribosyl 1,2-cyclic phosphate phosphodiesterase